MADRNTMSQKTREKAIQKGPELALALQRLLNAHGDERNGAIAGAEVILREIGLED